MRQSLLVAFAVLALHGASPFGTGLGSSSRSHFGAMARDLAWSSGSGGEATPLPDAAPLSIGEGKREKTESEDDTEASFGFGESLAGSHRLVPTLHARSHMPRELAAALRPPSRPDRLRC